MGYSMVEWDRIGYGYALVVLYVISKDGVIIGEGIGYVWLCRVGDDYVYDMVVEGKVG